MDFLEEFLEYVKRTGTYIFQNMPEKKELAIKIRNVLDELSEEKIDSAIEILKCLPASYFQDVIISLKRHSDYHNKMADIYFNDYKNEISKVYKNGETAFEKRIRLKKGQDLNYYTENRVLDNMELQINYEKLIGKFGFLQFNKENQTPETEYLRKLLKKTYKVSPESIMQGLEEDLMKYVLDELTVLHNEHNFGV